MTAFSFVCPTGSLCRVSIFRLLFVWTDSIIIVYAFFSLLGPTLTKLALTAAGEIRPEGRTSARVENKLEGPAAAE